MSKASEFNRACQTNDGVQKYFNNNVMNKDCKSWQKLKLLNEHQKAFSNHITPINYNLNNQLLEIKQPIEQLEIHKFQLEQDIQNNTYQIDELIKKIARQNLATQQPSSNVIQLHNDFTSQIIDNKINNSNSIIINQYTQEQDKLNQETQQLKIQLQTVLIKLENANNKYLAIQQQVSFYDRTLTEINQVCSIMEKTIIQQQDNILQSQYFNIKTTYNNTIIKPKAIKKQKYPNDEYNNDDDSKKVEPLYQSKTPLTPRGSNIITELQQKVEKMEQKEKQREREYFLHQKEKLKKEKAKLKKQKKKYQKKKYDDSDNEYSTSESDSDESSDERYSHKRNNKKPNNDLQSILKQMKKQSDKIDKMQETINKLNKQVNQKDEIIDKLQQQSFEHTNYIMKRDIMEEDDNAVVDSRLVPTTHFIKLLNNNYGDRNNDQQNLYAVPTLNKGLKSVPELGGMALLHESFFIGITPYPKTIT